MITASRLQSLRYSSRFTTASWTKNENNPNPTKMVTMYVTYSGDADTSFDRDYWIDSHLPLVRECWEPYGLVSVAGFSRPVRGKD